MFMESTSNKILVMWWGAIPGGGETAGDLISVINVLKCLKSASIEADISSLYPYPVLGEDFVDWQTVNPAFYSTLLFVCGPIIGNDYFRHLISRFVSCKKIAIGVSILPEASEKYYNPFDVIFERDGIVKENSSQFFDLTLSSLQDLRTPKKTNQKKEKIGICLRKKQREYGVENCLSEKIDNMLNIVLAESNYKIIEIDTKLNEVCRDPIKIYQSFADCCLIITTRLHGSLFCIGNLTPFIAIDQIKGGAKLSSVMKNTGWTHSFLAEDLTEGTLKSLIEDLLSKKNEYQKILSVIRENTVKKSQHTLNCLLETITTT